MLTHCIICRDVINSTEGRLCFTRRGFAVLWSAVSTGVDAASDWPGRLVNSREMQTDPACRSNTSWLVVMADINRFARYWLDGWDYTSDETAA